MKIPRSPPNAVILNGVKDPQLAFPSFRVAGVLARHLGWGSCGLATSSADSESLGPRQAGEHLR